MFPYSSYMPRRTYESEGYRVEGVEDLDALVSDKRDGWRATPAKARRRQRRDDKPLVKTILHADVDRYYTKQRPSQNPHKRAY